MDIESPCNHRNSLGADRLAEGTFRVEGVTG